MSFRKFTGNSQPIGSKVSIQNGATVTSTGIASLDDVLGGLPLGGLLLVREDPITGYGTLLLKYTLAQGIVHSHAVILVSLDNPKMLNELMGHVQGTPEPEETPTVSRTLGQLRDPSLKIAWRYQALPIKSSQNTHYCSVFDLTKKLSMDKANTTLIDAVPDYESLYSRLESLLKEGGYLSENGLQPTNKSILRIGIHSLLSPSWPTDIPSLIRMLARLKNLLIGSHAVCFVTLPAYLYNDYYGAPTHPLINRLHYSFDAVLEIESFSGWRGHVSESISKQANGFFRVLKLFHTLSAGPVSLLDPVQITSLSFVVRRKRFSIEVFTIPPEEDPEQDVKKESIEF